ncbi:hypothetical protein Agub_g2397 [Astrephomene gubernaculifera]|uniref:Uncharacterized protein n=1 Tax=Astrephomene gubernaculifera TaxID=47775 RepID=A0AAD3DH19_9CHLO|nr:hypothetical protein Agub_g2397 [Astrephomene gubernaculifera]
MDRVMVRISSGKTLLSSRFASPRGHPTPPAQQPQPPLSFQSVIYLVLALCGLFLVGHFVFMASESSTALRSSLRSVPPEAILQAQLLDKEKEIEKLRWEIDQIRKGVNVKESSISEQEGLIQQLKRKALQEHDAKTKAELALSDRAGALHECQQQKTALAGEVAQCHFDLRAVLGGESHTMSLQSSTVLRTMQQRQQEQQQRQREEQGNMQIGVVGKVGGAAGEGAE